MKIIVPLAIILFGSIDMIKAIISSESDSLKKNIISLSKKAVAGVIIFFIPSIISTVLSFVNSEFLMCEDNLNQATINRFKDALILENTNEQNELERLIAERQANESVRLVSTSPVNSSVNTSTVTDGVWFIQQWEGHGEYCDANRTTYRSYDINDGTVTCGYGVTNHLRNLAINNGYTSFPLVVGNCYSVSEIDAVQSLFIGQLYNELDRYLTLYSVSLEQHQKDAMVSVGYQSGGSVMKRCVSSYASGGNIGFWNQIKNRVYGNGNFYPGLKKRRDGEYNLFLTGEYNCGFYNRELVYY